MADTYHARAVRDGSFWSVRVLECDRTTQAQALDEIEPATRDLIAIMDEVPADSFDLEAVIIFPGRDARDEPSA